MKKVMSLSLVTFFTLTALTALSPVSEATTVLDEYDEEISLVDPIVGYDNISTFSTILNNREISLKSGQSVQMNVGGYIDYDYYSKYKIKVNILSSNNESVLIRRVGVYPHNGTRKNTFYFNSNKIELNFNLKKDAIPTNNNVNTGYETFIVTNFSPTELVFNVGINAGLELRKGAEDFSDLDFDL